jgi:lipoate-protein ligase A
VRVPEAVPSSRSLPSDLRNLCLASYSPGDLSVNGKKIGGSAQRRLREVWQQQGFFLLKPSPPPKGIESPPALEEANRLSSDLETCGYAVPYEELRDALTAALERYCGSLS